MSLYWVGFIQGAATMGFVATLGVAYARIAERLRERRGDAG